MHEMNVTMVAKDGLPVTLRRAELGDLMTVFEWQQHPETRRHSRNPQPPSLDGHRRWFADRIASPDCILMIIEHGGRPAGVFRLDRAPPRPGNTWEVSILVAPNSKRLGIASAALAVGERLQPTAELVAEVLHGNEASHALFNAAGYSLGSDGMYHLPPRG